MPRYFFDIENGGLYRDHAGAHLDTDEQAIREARLLVVEIQRDHTSDEDYRALICRVRREESPKPLAEVSVVMTVKWND